MQNAPDARRKEMLTGDVRILTLKIAAPSMAAMLATSAATLCDALLLFGHGTGVSAAVGACFPLLTLIQAIGFTLGMGSGSFVSRCLGRRETEAARCAASTALLVALVLCAGLLVPGMLFTQPLLKLLGAQGEALIPGVPYARYVLVCAPLLCANLVISSLLRAQGRTLPNMAAFTLGSAAGIACLFVLAKPMGIHGAGISMLLREGLTLALLIRPLLRDRTLLRPSPRYVRLTVQTGRDIMRSGLPTLLRQGAMSLSAVLLNRVSAGFGQTALAGMGLAVRAAAIVSACVIGFGQGFQPVCGVCFGAGNMQRLRDAYRFCMRTVTVAMLAAGAAVFFFARPLLALLGTQEDVIAFAAMALRAQSPFFFAMGAVVLMNMLTQAMGLTVRASLVASSRQGLFFVPLLLILPRCFGEIGLILCQGASDVLSLLFSLLLTHRVIQKASPKNGDA